MYDQSYVGNLMRNGNASDPDLLRLIASGDEHAFTVLYHRHQRAIYQFARLMSGMANVADEVVQEVFLTLLREPHRYDPARGSLAAYLYGIARNQLSRVFRREHPYIPLADDSDEEIPHPRFIARDDPFGDFTRNEVIKLVRQEVLSLPAHYREVVVLCDFQELTRTEAAAVLNCAVGTVNSRLHRGHGLLLKKLRARTVESGLADSPGMRCFA
jgi:RNA polymerase sigma-70 factor (ECF subfamily)